MKSSLKLRAPKSDTYLNVSFYIKPDLSSIDTDSTFVLGSGCSDDSISLLLNLKDLTLTSSKGEIFNACIRRFRGVWFLCSFDIKLKDKDKLVLINMKSVTVDKGDIYGVCLEEGSGPSAYIEQLTVHDKAETEPNKKVRVPSYYEKFNSRNNFRRK